MKTTIKQLIKFVCSISTRSLVVPERDFVVLFYLSSLASTPFTPYTILPICFNTFVLHMLCHKLLVSELIKKQVDGVLAYLDSSTRSTCL